MRAFLLAMAFLWTHSAWAASFDCKKAASPMEKAICANPKLDALDESLGMYYAAARERVGTARECLISDQRAWLGAQRNRCKDDACLERAYLNRLAELEPLVPGAVSIRYVELPVVKQLIAILPPAEDKVAAPAVRDVQVLTVRGSLQDKVASGGDGLVITSEGKDYVVTLLMFLDKATEDLQNRLKATQGGGSYEVQGLREVGADSFAPSRCRFVYSLPPK